MQDNPTARRGFLALATTGATVGVASAISGLPAWVTAGSNAVAIAGLIAIWTMRPKGQGTSEIIAEVSHELRTPLTGIISALDLLTEPTMPLEDSEVKELLHVARGEASHLAHIVGNLHARSSLIRSVARPERVPTDLRDIVTRAVARAPQVERRSFLSPGDAVVVIADPQVAMQIVTNLIQNISRYAPEGEVRISFHRTESQLKATFTDSGPGVPPFRAESIFEDGASTKGLGLGLGLSRELARAMGGDLTLENPGEPGASFALELPAGPDLDVETAMTYGSQEQEVRAYSPRARLLVDLAEALTEPSLDHVVGGIQKLYTELLGATGVVLFVSRADRSFHAAGTHRPSEEILPETADELIRVADTGETISVEDVAVLSWVEEESIGGRSAVLLPVHDANKVVAILTVGWKCQDEVPQGPAMNVAKALADLIAPAIARTALARDVAFEKQLRASVIEELPLAVSIFVGDPPQVVAWNRKERELLGLNDDAQRPADLETSQREFDVRFADGTPLTLDNAPVTTAIRTGQAAGPFMLLVRRDDGSRIHTRTYCAPFFDENGNVTGAVVTSEAMDVSLSPGYS